MTPARTKNRNRQQGFTLLEVSIVLVIIGLLTGGIIAGNVLIKSAELNGTTSDIRNYVASYNIFREKYRCVPGDCLYATRYFEDVDNGDGDGLIDCALPSAGCTAPTDEQIMAIKELRQAELLSGDVLAWNSNALLIETKLRNCRIQYYSSDLYQKEENNLRIFALTPSIENCMSPEEAFMMDGKIDDGNPSMGSMLSMRISGSPQSDCVSTDYTAAPQADGKYNIDNDEAVCALFVRF